MSIDTEEQYDKIYRYCYFKLSNRQTAEDITQETFLRYFEAYHCLTAEQALKCLYTIARNLCVDEYRRRPGKFMGDGVFEDAILQSKNFQSIGLQNNNLSNNHLLWGSEEEKILLNFAVKSALSQMEKEEQELLLLRYVNEVPVSVIGKTLGISRFAAHRKIVAASKKLKEKLKKEGFS